VTRKALQRLNESRNLTEHEYAIPVESEVRLFSDVVALFIEATNRNVVEHGWDFYGPGGFSIGFAPSEGKMVFKRGNSARGELPASDPSYVEIVGLAVRHVREGSIG
jgi:hypothetical protein